jgi:hypothetical protein
MIQFKPEVRIARFTSRLATVLEHAAAWSLISRVGVEVNSVNDGPGVHMATSLHYFDLAVDLDTVGDKAGDLQQLAEYMRRWLDPQYDVVFENNHVHVEWDAHRGPLLKVT